MSSFALWTLVNYLDDKTAWFVRVVVDDDRTVRFDLTNQMQMWRETLNQDEFRHIQRNWSKFDQHQWCSKLSSIEIGNRGEHVLQCEQISDRICVIGSTFDLLRKTTMEEKMNLVMSASISGAESNEEEEREEDSTKSLLSSESDDDENQLSEVSKIPKKILRL
ncbi:hypothetical protein D917_07753 [Trichinella nativa]|uniref:Uncharacterized protein n=1 Tax=Trichinella nativa TaxID=6335 RepID=A0A1Y3EMK6_9BILA|nr:hypothetical protein D917_07753 [Trichinella nativa]